MKGAPIVALAAIAVLLMAVAQPHRARSGLGGHHERTPVDFTGVDTLVVEFHDATVVLDGEPVEGAVMASAGRFEAVREGATMTLRPLGRALHGTRVHAPPTLRAIELRGREVIARVPVDALEIRAHGYVQWRGDARSLRLVDLGSPRADCARDCGNILSVSGRIDNLSARTAHGTVALEHAESVGNVVLELGADAEYELGGLHGPPRPVTLRPFEASPAVTDAAPKPAPDSPPAEPPRGD